MEATVIAVTNARERATGTTALATAGLVGPIVFTLLVVVQGIIQPDYSHVALPISALAAWPSGWIQNVNFLLLSALMGTFAIGMHLQLPHKRGGAVGPGLLLLSSVGLLVAAAFPWRADAGGFIVPPGHIVGAFVCFLGAGSGLALLSRRMADDPHWGSFASYALISGVVIIVLFFALFALAGRPNAPLQAWGGLGQRVVVAVWFACTIILAHRARSL